MPIQQLDSTTLYQLRLMIQDFQIRRQTHGRGRKKPPVLEDGEGGDDDDGFDVIVGVATLVDDNTARWAYAFVECIYTPTGLPIAVPGGRSGTMYNGTEAINPSSGIGQMGSGQTVSSADFAAGLILQPITAGIAVRVRLEKTCMSGSGSGSGSGGGSGSGSGDGWIWMFNATNFKKDCLPGT